MMVEFLVIDILFDLIMVITILLFNNQNKRHGIKRNNIVRNIIAKNMDIREKEVI